MRPIGPEALWFVQVQLCFALFILDRRRSLLETLPNNPAPFSQRSIILCQVPSVRLVSGFILVSCILSVWDVVYFPWLVVCDWVQLCSPPGSSSLIVFCVVLWVVTHSCAVPGVFPGDFFWLLLPVSGPQVTRSFHANKHSALCSMCFHFHVIKIAFNLSQTDGQQQLLLRDHYCVETPECSRPAKRLHFGFIMGHKTLEFKWDLQI